MPKWIHDQDGLIQAADQQNLRHPSRLAVDASDAIALGDSVNPGPLGAKALVRLSRGTYIECAKWNGLSRLQRYVIKIKAMIPRTSSLIITGEAAAALLGLPLLLRSAGIALSGTGRDVKTPQYAGDYGSQASAYGLVRRVGKQVAQRHLVVFEGRQLTDITKSVVDICRTTRSENGLIVADAALRYWCTRAELIETLNHYPRSPGNRQARRIISLATEKSESVGETLTKKCILSSGIASLHDEKRPLL